MQTSENSVEWVCPECFDTVDIQGESHYHECPDAGFGRHIWVCPQCEEAFEISAQVTFSHNCPEYCHLQMCTCFTDVNIAYPESGVFQVGVVGGVAQCMGSLLYLEEGGKRRCNCGKARNSGLCTKDGCGWNRHENGLFCVYHTANPEFDGWITLQDSQTTLVTLVTQASTSHRPITRSMTRLMNYQ